MTRCGDPDVQGQEVIVSFCPHQMARVIKVRAKLGDAASAMPLGYYPRGQWSYLKENKRDNFLSYVVLREGKRAVSVSSTFGVGTLVYR